MIGILNKVFDPNKRELKKLEKYGRPDRGSWSGYG